MKRDKEFNQWMMDNNHNLDVERSQEEWDNLKEKYMSEKNVKPDKMTLDKFYASSTLLREIGIPPRKPFTVWLTQRSFLVARTEEEWIELIKEYKGETK